MRWRSRNNTEYGLTGAVYSGSREKLEPRGGCSMGEFVL